MRELELSRGQVERGVRDPTDAMVFLVMTTRMDPHDSADLEANDAHQLRRPRDGERETAVA